MSVGTEFTGAATETATETVGTVATGLLLLGLLLVLLLGRSCVRWRRWW